MLSQISSSHPLQRPSACSYSFHSPMPSLLDTGNYSALEIFSSGALLSKHNLQLCHSAAPTSPALGVDKPPNSFSPPKAVPVFTASLLPPRLTRQHLNDYFAIFLHCFSNVFTHVERQKQSKFSLISFICDSRIEQHFIPWKIIITPMGQVKM